MELENRKKILHIFEENPTWSYSMISKAAGIPKSTVFCVIKRFKKTLTIERAKGSGRKLGTGDKKLAQQVMRSIKQNPELSDRNRAKKNGTSSNTVRRIRLKAGYKCFRAIKVPNRNDIQEKSVKKRSRMLYDQLLTKLEGCFIMDDETYVKVDQGQCPGQKFYVANERLNVHSKYEYIKLDKYGKKMLIWQAICTCGLKSQPYVTSSTLTTDLYIKECLTKRLLPFIRRHDSSTLFWPDLATCHYSRRTIAWYEENNVAFVPKEMNPPNSPNFRPIERYWAITKKYFKKT